MTDLNTENRELSIDELTIDELDSVSGGRIKIQGINPAVLAHEIAQLQQDQPGFI
jgi:bacteriocin-like protein